MPWHFINYWLLNHDRHGITDSSFHMIGYPNTRSLNNMRLLGNMTACKVIGRMRNRSCNSTPRIHHHLRTMGYMWVDGDLILGCFDI